MFNNVVFIVMWASYPRNFNRQATQLFVKAKAMFTPIVKATVTIFQENVKILASTFDVMVVIKDDVAFNMALNGNALLTKEVN